MTFFLEKLKLTRVQLKTQLEVQQNEKYRLQCGMYNFIFRLLLFVSCCFGSASLLERMNNKMDRKHWKERKGKKKKGKAHRTDWYVVLTRTGYITTPVQMYWKKLDSRQLSFTCAANGLLLDDTLPEVFSSSRQSQSELFWHPTMDPEPIRQ